MASANAEPMPDAELSGDGGRGVFMEWVTRDGAWYASSFVFHMLLMCFLMLLSAGAPPMMEGQDAPSFEEAEMEERAPDVSKIDRFEVGETPLDPTELNTDTLTMMTVSAADSVKEEFNDDSPVFSPSGGGGAATAMASSQPNLGGLGGFNLKAFGSGPALRGAGGVGLSQGMGSGPGAGGAGSGFGGRGTGSRKAMVGGFGGTRQSERAVAAALNWIARHQMPDGSWSLQRYQVQCKDRTCTYPGTHMSNSAATALALLPFLAAGQTHKSRGLYQRNIYAGLYWMIRQQNKDGDLSGKTKAMYAHGLATIMLCEAYGLTSDKIVGQAAQRAVQFIEKAQHPRTGGWRYQPGQEGDTSVVGWQVMALKSAQMAGLTVSQRSMDGAKNWLKLASAGKPRGRFSYTPESGPTPSMTAVGLLCSQYMGVPREDPIMIEGMKYLMGNMPNPRGHNIYYWYYATQVLHNMPGPDWDKWNRQMRRVLIETQAKEGCAAGSWDPGKPAKDAWADAGGRLMLTSLSALTLEVYYRYLPLYKLDTEAALKAPKPLSKSVAEKTSDQSVESAMTKPASEMEKEKKAAEPKKPADKGATKPAEKPAAKPAEKPAAKAAAKPAAKAEPKKNEKKK